MNSFSWFRKVALWEGVSFLLLLFVAMPLKYWGDMPKAVTIVGGVHGALFVAFAALAIWVKEEHNKNLKWLAGSMVASILPFGTFVLDKRWKKEQTASGR
jgi:integral membrane protein